KKPKSVALQSTKTSSKALKAMLVEIEEEFSVDGHEEELEYEEEETRKFQQWAKMNRKNFKSNGSRNSGYKDKKEDQKNCFYCKTPEHFIVDCP
ncbi:serine/threonine protein kinase SRPK1, partial [Trifolium medium]|nr:serine/threonine protein kinase SRPK1 [Trifolium medium]